MIPNHRHCIGLPRRRDGSASGPLLLRRRLGPASSCILTTSLPHSTHRWHLPNPATAVQMFEYQCTRNAAGPRSVCEHGVAPSSSCGSMGVLWAHFGHLAQRGAPHPHLRIRVIRSHAQRVTDTATDLTGTPDTRPALRLQGPSQRVSTPPPPGRGLFSTFFSFIWITVDVEEDCRPSSYQDTLSEYSQ